MIEILNRQRRFPVNRGLFSQVTAELLRLMDKSDYDVSIVFLSDRGIRKFNRDYRGKSSPTNVLSFPQHEDLPAGDFHYEDPDLPELDKNLGDILISLETAHREAAQRFETEVAQLSDEQSMTRVVELIIHGLLHLSGVHHDTEEAEELMHERSVSLFAAVQKVSHTS